MALNVEPAFFPVNEMLVARMVVAARRVGADAGRLTNAILRAVWAGERNIADAETLTAIAGENDMDGAALLTAAENAEVADDYSADTTEAVELGVFGAPTFVSDGQLYWGPDRLDFLSRALDT
ncbi:MAG: DsbA family protein [Alphaproteobacteria bacterium]